MARMSKLSYAPAAIADRYWAEQCKRLGPITPPATDKKRAAARHQGRRRVNVTAEVN